ncbi:MAG: sodium:solute symporter family protein [Deltaproteobacteria bacterium]|nr:sodium:solute symporter family protein [Deltaproteobacteria bacterium]
MLRPTAIPTCGVAVFLWEETTMETRLAVIAGYFVAVLGIGLMARTRWRSTPEEFFLAGRGLGSFVLLGTMMATNFSAFTVFGASGAGYRDGYAFFPIMGFGTGFMALNFWLLGRKVWEIGKFNNILTPAELIAFRYESRYLSVLFALVMIVFTIPYLALQPMAGGYVLQELFGIPHSMGAFLITAAIMLYVFRGGLKAVAWTDVFQGILMVTLMIAALIMVAQHYGGFGAANEAVRAIRPELMSRPGGQGRYSPEIWISYLMLWFFCDPMFPQLFQRFFSAKDAGAIRRSMLLYPLVCNLVFFLPVTLGVFGTLAVPGLTGKQADQILPIMLTHIFGDFMATLIMSAGLAALMSTMDSQLLTLSSIFTRDIFPFVTRKLAGNAIQGKIFVVFLSMIGLFFATRPSSTILKIATQAFTGLAVLFPTTLFALYSKKPSPGAAITSIILGEVLVVFSYLGWFPSGGFLPAIPIVIIAFMAYLVVMVLSSSRFKFATFRVRGNAVFAILFATLFILSVDWWQWSSSRYTLGGFPLWIFYFMGLSAVQTLLMKYWSKDSQKETLGHAEV